MREGPIIGEEPLTDFSVEENDDVCCCCCLIPTLIIFGLIVELIFLIF
jgi:hypothetical protein